ncbi:methyltransferase domain-containing protein [Bradyrhizobium sp. 172]|uniref:class I SAM-dependent methyltransferase n=1 Tax=Bradyrhizobium sp. 172 TaxID=2782643 RepID=UPI001FFEED89|nr:methyltransferase domain-containing protein [Bradyrhizobium sp. 172]UPJ98258.1 methyltransferase domain-containing protein [Bradyrhizobium sp. 172]
MVSVLKKFVLSVLVPVRRLEEHRNILRAESALLKEKLTEAEIERNELRSRVHALRSEVEKLLYEHGPLTASQLDEIRKRSAETDFIEKSPIVLQYRRAHLEVYGTIAPGMPDAKSWPAAGAGLSYRDKLIGHLDVEGGRGAEIGPLNDPLLFKPGANVLYVDHLDTAGIREKYKSLNDDIYEVDRPMVEDSLYEALKDDAPLDYVVASQVMEHVPNPIRWMLEIASALRADGVFSLSLLDRRMTSDLYRQESRASDMITAYFHNNTVPDVRSVYDHYSEAPAVNMHSAIPDSVVERLQINDANDPMAMARRAYSRKYLDVRCWVFTPVSFLLLMAQIAGEGLVPFRLKQFYPTDPSSRDRGNHSFAAVLEKSTAPASELRRSFLEALA